MKNNQWAHDARLRAKDPELEAILIDEDPLAPARGVVFGVVIGLLLWVAFTAVLFWLVNR